jgi:hypothetical protein
MGLYPGGERFVGGVACGTTVIDQITGQGHCLVLGDQRSGHQGQDYY